MEGREAAEAVGPQGRQQLPRWGGAPIAPAARPSKVAWVGRGGEGAALWAGNINLRGRALAVTARLRQQRVDGCFFCELLQARPAVNRQNIYR